MALFYVGVSAWYGRDDLTVLSAALAGGLSAFLLYNFHPAKVFMGDTGSLFLGGMVCGLAFALNIPLVIPIIGLVYVAEVLSDIIQVVYFKKTGGKRFFRMAPLHHHLEMGGWSETKLFCVFFRTDVGAVRRGLSGSNEPLSGLTPGESSPALFRIPVRVRPHLIKGGGHYRQKSKT